MKSRKQFVFVFLGSVAWAALVSHGLFHLMGIQPILPAPDFGSQYHAAPIHAAGSSLVYYGFDWDAIAHRYERPVKMLGVPAASPCELEVRQNEVGPTDFTILGVAESDLDEDAISDFRADIVPFSVTFRDLQRAHWDQTLVKRTMCKYPLRYARILFPLAGRPLAIPVAIRERWRRFRGRHNSSAAEPLPTFDVRGDWPTNRLSDWDGGRILRNAELMRQLTDGHHSFSGPKHWAMERMLRNGLSRGTVVVIVLPDSPLYMHDVIDADVVSAFEKSIAELTQLFPQVHWVRLDHEPKLSSNDVYWDLAHLNATGREIATAELMRQLPPGIRRQ
jgi:hypothetical protein